MNCNHLQTFYICEVLNMLFRTNTILNNGLITRAEDVYTQSDSSDRLRT